MELAFNRFYALIIDDDRNTRAVLAEILMEVGWEVLEAENGALGLDAFNQLRPDLVIVGWRLPAVDGRDVCRQIQPDAHLRHAPMLVLTPLDDVAAVDQAFDLGALDCFNKPLNVPFIRRRLHALLRHAELDRTIRRAKLEWEAAVDVVADCVIITDLKGRITRCNQAAIQRLDTNYAELLGRPLNDVFFGQEPVAPSEAQAFVASTFETQFSRLPGWYRITNYAIRANSKHPSLVHVVRDITGQREAEQALRDSEERFRAMVENMADGIMLLDVGGIVKYVSPSTQGILGYPTDEQLGLSALSLVHPADQARVQGLFRQLVQVPGSQVTYECQVRCKDGSWRWIEVTACNALHLSGVKAVVANYHDTTERRKTQESLALQAGVLANLVEGVFICDTDRIIRYSNHGMDAMFGFASGELVGQPVSVLDDGVMPESVAAEITSQIETGKIWMGEMRDRRKDGTPFTTDNRVSQVSVGGVVYNVGLKMDITERRQAEESLALQAGVLFNMAEAVFIMRMDTTIVFTNRAMDAMFGYATGELLGQLAAVLDKAPDARTSHEIEMALATGNSWAGEIQDHRKDGTPFYTDNRVSLIMVKGVPYVASLKMDITERKQTQAWILNTQKLADLGTLAAGVAHELNSPLQVITGLSESLIQRLDNNHLEPDYLRQRLDVLHRNGWRCAEIVRSLHNYARISAGQVAAAQLNDLVHDCLLLMEHQLSSWSNITIRTELAPELPQLQCDANQITQVLINLLTNAKDAMPSGGEIVLRTSYDPQAEKIALQVIDGGTGIPEEIRAKIFDPFYTTKAIGKGTGLGLSIVAGILRAYGGDIQLDSALGRGTTFTLHFPLRPPVVARPAEANEPASAGRFDDVSEPVLAGPLLGAAAPLSSVN